MNGHDVLADERDTEAYQRAALVTEAMEWERTPYVHQGRIKGRAADCTFFARVFQDAGLLGDVAIPNYSPQAHVNRQAAAYLSLVEKHAKREVTEAQAQPGDVVLFNIARTFSHGALIIPPGWPHMLHADMGARFVIRARGDVGQFDGRERRFFSFW